jgi:two-component system sensor histidine kinase/response regulator
MPELKALIVDDEPEMRLGIQRVLSKFTPHLEAFDTTLSFATKLCENGAEAKAALTAGPWDIILLDYKMPDVTGLDILTFMQAEKIDTTTIMVTAYASLEVAVSATKNGAFDFLAKPFSPEELRAVIAKAAEHIFANRQALQLAAEKRRVRFEFLSVLAHELKSPLAAVENYLRVMEKHTAGDEIAAYDKMIQRSLIRLEGMRKLIFDMLDLTRIESGHKRRDLQKRDIIPILESALEGIRLAAAERNLHIEVIAIEACQMVADAGEIEIILNDLLSNAVKYNRHAGKILIELTQGVETISLRVADTGIGMSATEMEKLFGEFVRIKNEDTRLISGSGLGLSIVRKLVNLYNGSIDVESTKGEGTEFTVTLPLQPQSESVEVANV